ncbi:hypothetical protein CN391_18195 [Bacillus anthracis]|nr:hypothetical protein CN391_18195 [Bacillus anthracis]
MHGPLGYLSTVQYKQKHLKKVVWFHVDISLFMM